MLSTLCPSLPFSLINISAAADVVQKSFRDFGAITACDTVPGRCSSRGGGVVVMLHWPDHSVGGNFSQRV